MLSIALVAFLFLIFTHNLSWAVTIPVVIFTSVLLGFVGYRSIKAETPPTVATVPTKNEALESACVNETSFSQSPIQTYDPEKPYGVSVKLTSISEGTIERLRVFSNAIISDAVLTAEVGNKENTGSGGVHFAGKVADIGLESYQREFRLISSDPIKIKLTPQTRVLI